MIEEKKRAFKSYCIFFFPSFYLLLRCVEAAVVVHNFFRVFLGGVYLSTYTYKDNGENS